MLYILTLTNSKDQHFLPHLAKSLDWLDIPYQWCIGVTESFVDIKQFTNNPYMTGIWFKNFSQAKNELMNQIASMYEINVTNDWFLWLDADEVYQPILKAGVPTPFESLNEVSDVVGGFRLTIVSPARNIMNEVTVVRSTNTRLFRANFRYCGDIHENIMVEIDAAGLRILDFRQGYIGHFGYDIPVEAIKEKIARNDAYLRQMLEKDPNNSMCWLYLARAENNKGNNAKALEYYKNALALPKIEQSVINDYNYFRQHYMLRYANV